MPKSDRLSSEGTIVQDIMADSNINPNLLQAAINTLSSRINVVQSAQATPTLGKIDSSGFYHQTSGLETQAHPLLIVQALTTRGQDLEDKPYPPVVNSPFVPPEVSN